MKSNPPFTLSVPTPCTESWKEMTPEEKGRFCQQCQKTVIDFSVMSDQEMAVIINSSKGELCGRFLMSQLNREIGAIKRHTPLRKIAAVISALALSVPAVSAMQSKTATTQSPVRKDISNDTTTNNIITGQVVDSIHAALPGAKVRIKDTNVDTRADVNGKFVLQIPVELIGKDVPVQVSFIGMISKDILVSPKDTVTDLVIALNPYPFEDTVVTHRFGGIGMVTTKPTFWQRTKRKVRNLFH